MLRFEFYRVKRRDNLAAIDFWNDRFKDLDLRIAATEAYSTTIDDAVDGMIAVALQTLTQTFTPLIEDAQERLNTLGVSFFAESTTSLTLPLSGQVAMTLAEEYAQNYVYTDYVSVRSEADQSNQFLAQVVSFDREAGSLILSVVSSEGTGAHTDWLIRVGTPPEAGHAERTDNPHETTAAQVGSYTTAQTDAAIDAAIALAIASLPPISTALLKANNLTDLTDVPAARTAMGLGLLAIESSVGLTMFASNVRATQAQAEGGIENTALMTSLRTSQQYVARISDQSTAETGTDNTKSMTPLRVKQSIQANIQGVKQNIQSANYTCVLGDRQRHVYHPASDTTARTWTIPANASVPYDIGDVLTFVVQNGAGAITITINSDTLRLAGAGTTGNRTLAPNGMATALKVGATEWLISGTGLS